MADASALISVAKSISQKDFLEEDIEGAAAISTNAAPPKSPRLAANARIAPPIGMLKKQLSSRKKY